MLHRRSSGQSSSGKPHDVVCRNFYAKKTFPRKSLHVHQKCQFFGFWQGYNKCQPVTHFLAWQDIGSGSQSALYPVDSRIKDPDGISNIIHQLETVPEHGICAKSMELPRIGILDTHIDN